MYFIQGVSSQATAASRFENLMTMLIILFDGLKIQFQFKENRT